MNSSTPLLSRPRRESSLHRDFSRIFAVAMLVLALAACRDPGPAAETAPAPDAAAGATAGPEPVAAPSALLEIDAFEGARLELDGKLRTRTETPVQEGTRHVVRVEHFYPTSQDALADIELQMQAAGYHVTLSEDGSGARVFSPDGQKGSVEIIDAADHGDVEMADPAARGLVSLFWVTPPKTP